jgi:hypothetical protein
MARDDQERFHAPQQHEYTSASCFNCRFNCGSLVSRLPKGSGETCGKINEPTSIWPSGTYARPSLAVVSSVRGGAIGA